LHKATRIRGLDVCAEISKEIILERQERVAREKEHKERLKGFYDQARELYQNQKWQAVVDGFDQIHAEDPAYPDPEGLLASAREALEVQERERKVTTLYDEGWRHADASKWQRALECFDQVIRLQPDYAEAWRSKAVSQYNLGRYQEAIEAYDKAISLKPDFSDAKINRDNALRSSERS
jgi:tetratricopeptide (TPR) repeat protein